MPLIPEAEIERIKRETDLAAVVRARGVALKAQGGPGRTGSGRVLLIFACHVCHLR